MAILVAWLSKLLFVDIANDQRIGSESTNTWQILHMSFQMRVDVYINIHIYHYIIFVYRIMIFYSIYQYIMYTLHL